jgi:hypothetical protein
MSDVYGAQNSRILADRSALKRTRGDEQYTPAYPPGYTPEYEQTDQPETPYHPLEQGTLLIAGTVVNEASGPVSGIGVVAITQRLYGEQAELLDLGTNKRQRSTSTNSNGLFRFEALADGDYQIQTIVQDFYPLVASTTVRAGVDSARLVVVEEREIWVNGFVASTNGQALPQVGIYSSAATQQVGLSDASGSFDFPLAVRGDRGHLITFRSEGYQEQRISINRNDWANTDRVDLDIAMRPAEAGVLTVVSGTVRTDSGDPVAGEQIYLKRLQKKYKTTTNATGSFVFDTIESGDNYILWLTPQGPYRQYQQEHLRVPDVGLNDLAILLDPVQTASVAGWMKDNQGNPVSNFTLLARSYDFRSFAEQVTSDQSGYFEIHNVPDGRLRFESASFPRFIVGGIQLAAGSDIELDLKLDVGNQQIGGRVIDEGGNPVSGADITLSWVLREDGLLYESLRKTTANEYGAFQFTQLGTGTHSLIVGAPGFEGAKTEADPGSGAPIAGGAIEVQLRERAE